jgi:hypothetical protein
MCLDALTREESCGGHFREEHQTADGEAKRDDENFATSPPGSTRARASPGAQQGAAQLRATSTSPAELQMSRNTIQEMNLTLRVWRQDGPSRAGQVRDLQARRTSHPDMSFLEMLDVLNES